MKKIILVIYLFSLLFTSCDDKKDIEEKIKGRVHCYYVYLNEGNFGKIWELLSKKTEEKTKGEIGKKYFIVRGRPSEAEFKKVTISVKIEQVTLSEDKTEAEVRLVVKTDPGGIISIPPKEVQHWVYEKDDWYILRFNKVWKAIWQKKIEKATKSWIERETNKLKTGSREEKLWILGRILTFQSMYEPSHFETVLDLAKHSKDKGIKLMALEALRNGFRVKRLIYEHIEMLNDPDNTSYDSIKEGLGIKLICCFGYEPQRYSWGYKEWTEWWKENKDYLCLDKYNRFIIDKEAKKAGVPTEEYRKTHPWPKGRK